MRRLTRADNSWNWARSVTSEGTSHFSNRLVARRMGTSRTAGGRSTLRTGGGTGMTAVVSTWPTMKAMSIWAPASLADPVDTMIEGDEAPNAGHSSPSTVAKNRMP